MGLFNMISIVVLNWNTAELLINLYKSIINNSSENVEVIIVDNGSESADFNKLYDNVIKYNPCIIKSEENKGFAAGNNLGLKHVTGDLIVFINSDIEIKEKNWDVKFRNFFKNDIGVVGCAYHPLKWTKDGRFKIQPLVEESIISETVQGAFFAVPKNILNELKEKDGYFFDENFKFAHYEETDMQLRIMELGYKTLWIPLKHEHHHNQSATKKNGYKLNEYIQNEVQFKQNSEKNRQLLIKKHKLFFEGCE